MFSGIGSWFAMVWDKIITGMSSAGAAVIAMLPDSPFQIIDNSPVAKYMGYLNWIIPMNQIVGILELWVTAIVIYYLYVVILRWIKAIQ